MRSMPKFLLEQFPEIIASGIKRLKKYSKAWKEGTS